MDDNCSLAKIKSKSSQHCCVPLCTSDSKYNPELYFHHIPRNPDLRKEWIIKIRCDEGEHFNVSIISYPKSRPCFIIIFHCTKSTLVMLLCFQYITVLVIIHTNKVKKKKNKTKTNKKCFNLVLFFAGSINQLWTVACLLANFKGPIVKAWDQSENKDN